MSSKTLLDKVKQVQQEKNEKIIPENFSMNLNIFGVQGNILQSTGGDEIYEEPTETQTYIATYHTLEEDEEEGINYKLGHIEHSEYKSLILPNEMHTTYITAETLAQDIGLTANKIKKDETILGITGTYEGSSTSDRYLLYSEDREDYDEETGELLSHYLAYWIECNSSQITPEYVADIAPDGSADVVNCINSTGDVALLGACSVDSDQSGWHIIGLLGVNNTDNYYKVYTCDEDGEHKQPTDAIIPPHSMYVPGSVYISTEQQVPVSKLPAFYIEVLDV